LFILSKLYSPPVDQLPRHARLYQGGVVPQVEDGQHLAVAFFLGGGMMNWSGWGWVRGGARQNEIYLFKRET
jgi:hypothetical protein